MDGKIKEERTEGVKRGVEEVERRRKKRIKSRSLQPSYHLRPHAGRHLAGLQDFFRCRGIIIPGITCRWGRENCLNYCTKTRNTKE